MAPTRLLHLFQRPMAQQAPDQEIQTPFPYHLGVLAVAVLLWLAMIILASVVAVTLLLGNVIKLPQGVHAVVLCVIAGVLGSAVSALVSAWERIANGWELASGIKMPTDHPKDKFLARMSAQFFLRPFLGAVMGVLVYSGITGGYLITIQIENLTATQFRPEGLLFVSLLGGVFAKTFIEKLRDMFDALFGKQKS